ncbi:adhesion G-protein coupled receptor G7 isoform X6 [Canis lupus familiaris]|uniref:Adhesion G-protein coupled receptor G7 n=2 Tax=Canis lupus familiaris TaxID=9615 RepID=A0A8C0Z592_CANLF|nr:adhesion G-protein coupled receptor G7 isoform X6 [Canis lupus familiaris]|eukprot:XP_545075.3 adhesion G-protein coupled receptor G7 isoform X1 [Canis lupus familiaris]
MASCRACDLRVLVVIACGLVTIIILALGIWMTVITVQKGSLASSSTIPIDFCRNGGTWENGRCVCPDLWKGRRCTIANFCENSTYESFTFDRIPVGKYGSSHQRCDKDTLNAGNPMATRLCNITKYGVIVLQNVTIGNCNENLETLAKQIDNISSQSLNISNEAQILTSDAKRLTPDNVTSATRVVGQIFNTSRNASSEAKAVAVATVSQLLEAKEDVFQSAAAATDYDDTFATLIEQMEIYSTSLGNESVVEPNVAVQSVAFSSEGTEQSKNVRFSVKKGTSDSLTSGSTVVETNVDALNPDIETELQILLQTSKSDTKSCGFVVYQKNKLFQSKTFKTKSDFSQKIISSKTDKNGDQGTSVNIVFNPRYDSKEFQLYSYACVYWSFSKKDWDTNGCHKIRATDGLLYCHCNHTTNFAVLMSFEKKYKYPESLNILSSVGCALSITGLALTIVFQIVTRNIRKTSVTWVLVSLCISMLIFNLLFVFGIENSNKNLKKDGNNTIQMDPDANEMLTQDIYDVRNPTCTVVAALLHYFLLVTFTWTGLSAAQLYFLLIRTMKPLPQYFILFISLIGWGVPAVVVAMTLGIIFSQNGSQWELNYRQEEICWLAVSGNNGLITSPLLWSFIIPITIILINNIVIFIIIIVKVIWKTNLNLTSTKKVSSLKKVLSTLSISVVFGITWILAYFMLIGNEDVRIVFNYMFCLLNTTQGLQIFILYTVRTKIFQNKASEVLKSLSLSTGRVKLKPSVTTMRLRVRMYNMLRSLPTLSERFRLLEPSVIMEETTLSESDQANPSI